MEQYTLKDLEGAVDELIESVQKGGIKENDIADIIEHCGTIIDSTLSVIEQALNTSNVSKITRERAEGYWFAHIMTAIKNEHKYLGGSMTTLVDQTIWCNNCIMPK